MLRMAFLSACRFRSERVVNLAFFFFIAGSRWTWKTWVNASAIRAAVMFRSTHTNRIQFSNGR